MDIEETYTERELEIIDSVNTKINYEQWCMKEDNLYNSFLDIKDYIKDNYLSILEFMTFETFKDLVFN